MTEQHDLEVLLRSHIPIILVETLEEARLLELFTRISLKTGTAGFRWSVTEGLSRLEAGFGRMNLTNQPGDVLRHIKGSPQAGTYILLDFHPYLNDPLHVRLIKEIAQSYDEVAKTLVLVSHALTVPPEVRHLSVNFNLRLPDQNSIRALINDEARRWQGHNGNRRLKADRNAVSRLAENLSGTTLSDARRLVRAAVQDDGALTQDDLPALMKAKYELMNRDGIISFEYDTARFADLAGLDKLKHWLEQRRQAFTGQIPLKDKPKGIMLLGVQGGGKSLAAKAVAGHFGVPLLRLDFANLYNKYYGETEKNLRHALQTAEAMAPAVLWIDEIEKGIAADGSDEGLSQRVLGTLLTWMAERKPDVFIVATSNDIERLPPELIRKGRLDEIFFVDLPGPNTRKAIFDIHLRGRNQAPSRFDLDALAEASEGYSGAEIEQAVVSALYTAQSRDEALHSNHLLEELDRTRPLSVVMAEKMTQLRLWAAERTVPAH